MPNWKKVIVSGSNASLNSITASNGAVITGSVNISGSTTQVGTNNLFGNTTLSGSIIISGAFGANDPTVKIYGDTTHEGYIRFDPVSTNINQSLSASYIYVSGSTNDLYFTQNGNGFNNTTRLRWLEGNLYTGLLNGGIISIITGSTTFNLSSGSGIVVDLNASLNDNPYPTIKYVNWDNFTSQPLTFLTSSIQSYIGIDENGQITQQTTPFTDGEYNTKILIGTVLHQNKTTVNASITYPNVAYGYKQRSYDFIKAFGPLKLSGYTINPSSSLGLTIGGGTAFADGRNYQVDPNNPSYITDPGTTVSKIFRYYQSGSEFVQDTNGGLGYTVIDPANYNNNGTLTSVSPSTPFTIQRVFWYPNSATKGIVVYYGNAQYASISEAASNLNFETFSEVENTKQNAVYLGAIIIKYNGVFTNTADYSILPAGIFRSVGGSGGGGSTVTTRLVDLSDVNISGPTDYQALIYNGTSLKWENGSFISASISGNAATANTASYALSSLSSSYANNASTADTTQQINVTSPGIFGGNLLYVVNSGSATVYTPTIGTELYYNDGLRSLTVTSSYAYTASNADLLDGLNSTAFAQLASANRFTANQTITGSLTATGDIITQGNIVAQQYIISSSVAYFTESFSSGSTNFGNSLDDTHKFTGSVDITGSLTVNGLTTINANQLITGLATIGASSLGATENTLTLGARDAGSEGGQLGLNAPGGTYTSASMIDNYANTFRVLTGTNTSSNRMDLELSHVTQNLRIFGDVIAYAASDKRLKKNIQPINNALGTLTNIGGYTFDWDETLKDRHGHEGNDIGVIAQEIEKVLPEVVTTRESGYKAVKYEKIVPLLIEAIKELKAEVDRLKSGNYNNID